MAKRKYTSKRTKKGGNFLNGVNKIRKMVYETKAEKAAAEMTKFQLLSEIAKKINAENDSSVSRETQVMLVNYIKNHSDKDAIRYLTELNARTGKEIAKQLNDGNISTVELKESIFESKLSSIISSIIAQLKKNGSKDLVPIFEEYLGNLKEDEKEEILKMFSTMPLEGIEYSLRHYRVNKGKGGGRKTRRRKKSRKQPKSKLYV